ncbi:oxidoreductase [Sporolactobacillus shoreicorticis]|uniref:Oxidoreductase n=1 Tax=Sporolactobacillus shoreicorticis TaxID=1923877 RepID=A0ABW5RZG4_9BACL|nr:oxidoreductase [Sporolactobacillus shoreicorticis]MCO7127216.1 oxidoreductase [Sporolactobacillus shoreicorticis]
MKKIWLITGTSTGFGRSLGEVLIKKGYPVALTARHVDQIHDLVDGQEQAMALTLDVTKKKDVRSAVKQVFERFGRIDVLVNNAGYGYFGAVEECDEHEVRNLFETNFWGLSDLTRAVLPFMRKQRSGHIVNFSSIGGLTAFPAFGYYHATKFAVEGLSQALAKEVAPLGIKVTLVEPGAFRTDWAGRSALDRKEIIDDYADTAEQRITFTRKKSGTQPGSPLLAAQAIIKAIEAEESPIHLLLGKDAVQNARLQLKSIKKDLETWEPVSTHVDFGDEKYWE